MEWKHHKIKYLIIKTSYRPNIFLNIYIKYINIRKTKIINLNLYSYIHIYVYAVLYKDKQDDVR